MDRPKWTTFNATPSQAGGESVQVSGGSTGISAKCGVEWAACLNATTLQAGEKSVEVVGKRTGISAKCGVEWAAWRSAHRIASRGGGAGGRRSGLGVFGVVAQKPRYVASVPWSMVYGLWSRVQFLGSRV